jgi:hypothetical protein
MRKLLYIFIAAIIISSQILGMADFFMVSDVGTSARMIRIGNIDGFSPLASGVFENPASLYRTKFISASMFTTTFMEEVQYVNLAGTARTPFGVFGAGYMNVGVPDIPFTQENEFGEYYAARYFNYDNMQARVAYQYSQTPNLHLGIAGVYYQTNIDQVTGKGFNCDIGMIWDIDFLKVSVVMRNIATSLKVNYENAAIKTYKQQENLPLQTVYGIQYNWNGFEMYGQIKQDGNNKNILKSVGVNLRPSFAPFLSISGGYKEFPDIKEVITGGQLQYQDTVGNNWVAGVGLDLLGVSFDYAYETSEHFEFNHKHYFSVGVSL